MSGVNRPCMTAIAVVVAALLPGCASHSGTQTARRRSAPVAMPSGTIAFVDTGDPDWDVAAVRVASRRTSFRLRTAAGETDPAWSPDGRTLLVGRYVRSVPRFATPNLEIFSFSGRGDEGVRLTHYGGLDARPAWSPDGTKIAFARSFGGGPVRTEIFLMSSDGSDLAQITHTPGPWSSGSPAWSPDGKRLAFTSTRKGGNSDVYVMDADGSDVQVVVDGDAEETDPAWSPDGDWIAFTRRGARPSADAIFSVSADGSDLSRLTLLGRAASDPSWSPDGRWIAFVGADRAGGVPGAIYVAEATAGAPWRLIARSRQAALWQPTWGPDGVFKR